MSIPRSCRTTSFVVTLLAALGLFAASAQAQPKGLKFQGEFSNLQVKERGGTFLVLTFNSAHPVVPLVVASRKPLTMKKEFKDFANPKEDFEAIVLPFLLGPRTTHQVALKNLKPGAEYKIGIIGQRKDGGPVFMPVVNTKFKTLNRKVRVNFTSIAMTNDSDDLSDGDFTFYFFAFDKSGVDSTTKPLVADVYAKGDDWIGTGETKSIHVTLKTITYNSEILWVGVSGMDKDPSDTLFGPPFISFPSGVVYKGSGSDPKHEWASGLKAIELGGSTVDGSSLSAQEKYSRSFTITVIKGDVGFKTFGTVDIWYE